MSMAAGIRIIRSESPGEVRAVAIGADGRAFQLFMERWQGAFAPAAFGTFHRGRIRAFADDLKGAFLSLDSGEEAFLRLKSRDGLTEGTRLSVRVASAARAGKLARVTRSDLDGDRFDAWSIWMERVAGKGDHPIETDHGLVDAAFEDALAPSVTLPGGGRLHCDRTRALTAFDVDTAGRHGKGSAGARALSVNKDAAIELARQAALRGLGGLLALDCVDPLNTAAQDQIQRTAQQAFTNYRVPGAKVLKPSAFGLLQASVPWRDSPLSDRLAADPDETELLSAFRSAAREARADPARLFGLELSKSAGRAYQKRRVEADAALTDQLNGRLTVRMGESYKSRIALR